MNVINEHIGLTKEEFIENNKKLVYSICNKYKNRAYSHGMEYEDLVSVGMIGLIKAYTKYDPTKFDGMVTSVTTYAVPVINGELLRTFRDDEPSGVKFSRSMKEVASQIYKQNLEIEKPHEISKTLNVSEKMVLGAIQFIKQKGTKNLEDTMYKKDSEALTYADMFGNEDDNTSMFVQDFVNRLPSQLKRVIQLKMNDLTQQQIADEVGVSQVQVGRYLKQIGNHYKNYSEGDIEMKPSQGNLEEANRLIKESNLSPVEIASRTGCNINTLRVYCAKLRKKSTEDNRVVTKKVEDENRSVLESVEMKKKESSVLDYFKMILDGKTVTVTDEEMKNKIESAIETLGSTCRTETKHQWTISLAV